MSLEWEQNILAEHTAILDYTPLGTNVSSPHPETEHPCTAGGCVRLYPI